MPFNKKAEELADFIEANPNCIFEIDNDTWFMYHENAKETPDADDNVIAVSDDYGYYTNWYGHSSNYGAGISEALIILLNRRGFKIEATAV